MKHEHSTHDAALLLARIAVGTAIASHGTQKLFGWFGGPGPSGAAQMMSGLGFQPGDRMAKTASLTEISAGVLIATGTGGPLGALLLASVMTTAAGSVHAKNGFFAQNGGVELNVMYALLALVLSVEDHGRFSVDEAIGLRENMHPAAGLIATALGVAAGAYILSKREKSPKLQEESAPQAGSSVVGETPGSPASNVSPATQ